MISELTDLPNGVIGFEAAGKLPAEEYRDVLLPAIERAASAGDIRLVLVIRSFEGLTVAPCGRTSKWASSISGPGDASPS